MRQYRRLRSPDTLLFLHTCAILLQGSPVAGSKRYLGWKGEIILKVKGEIIMLLGSLDSHAWTEETSQRIKVRERLTYNRFASLFFFDENKRRAGAKDHI